jgi:D-lactate dehydrogenase
MKFSGGPEYSPNPTMTDAAPKQAIDSDDLRNQLARIIEPKRILTRPIERIAFASDASFYRLVPKAVVLARSIGEIRSLFEFSHRYRIPLTFRAAGTSLSGQAITDGILVEVARHWREVKIEAGGKKVRVQPGVIAGYLSRLLAPYGTKLGPDPASIDACTIGGILSNNSSGMCCGVAQNAYHTLESLTFVLPSGTVIDTASAQADQLFQVSEPKLAEGLLQLKREILANSVLRERIRRKYKTKNTTGYSLNAFLDFERPIDIFRHLLIGSEGTLAFIAEAVINTVPDLRVKYTGLLLFNNLHAACASIVPLRKAGAKAIELMDREALRSVQQQEGIPPSIKLLPKDAAGLLVEFQSADEGERALLESAAKQVVSKLHLCESASFTHSPSDQALLWKIRKGMFPSVAAVRRRGSGVILEDIVLPVERLADAIVDLRQLFTKHGYEDAIVFGHAKDGNLHFMITQSFNEQADTNRYAGLMEDIVRLVVERYDGSLKGEHGTGRNMAPFVDVEWGSVGADIMRRLKNLSDPDDLLNPGVIINADPRAHLTHLKDLPLVAEEVDKCIECGYCETRCPSRDLTLTPRQRINVLREMKRLQNAPGEREMATSLKDDFSYMGLDTCAVDGLCALACPVGIDTGALTKRLRRESHSPTARRRAEFLASNVGWVESALRVALRTGHFAQSIAGADLVNRLIRGARVLTGQPFPLWSPDLPYAASSRPLRAGNKNNAQAVYFPSCISRVMGFLPSELDDSSLTQAFVTVAVRAGLSVFIPGDIQGTCCGIPFSSKGYELAHRIAVNRSIERFWNWSDEGRMPIVIDTSPCTYGLLTSWSQLEPQNQHRLKSMRIIDSVAFAHDELLPRLKVKQKLGAIALHPVCSLTKMNLASKLEAIGRECSQEVFVPGSSGCCGFAGDRGLLFPELTEAATRQFGAEVKAGRFDGYFSSSRTCELAMTRAVGRVYRSHLYLLEKVTRDESAVRAFVQS